MKVNSEKAFAVMNMRILEFKMHLVVKSLQRSFVFIGWIAKQYRLIVYFISNILLH